MLKQRITRCWQRFAKAASFFIVKQKFDIPLANHFANHYLCDMHDSRQVANEILKVAGAHGQSLTPMQLLKLTYIAHGWSLGLYGDPLISDEIQAWEYGPVIPSLYAAVKDFRDQPVHGLIAANDEPPLSDADKKVIRQVVQIYGAKSGPALSRLTHAPGTPWAQVYEPGSWGLRIPNDIIEDHYQRLAEERA
jgi:uncharacterized phage-associated protein